MECFEHGLVTEADLGFRAHFGDAAAMVRLTEMLASGKASGTSSRTDRGAPPTCSGRAMST